MFLFSKPIPVLLLKKLLYTVTLAFFICVIIFCLFYCCSGYEALKTWYYSLNNTFYNHETWANNFFTPLVKTKGNYLAVTGCIISIISILYIVSGWRKLKTISATIALPHATRQQVAWYAAVLVLATLMGMSSFSLTTPEPDELFSAVNCAMLPAFQCISYYMLPNNHIYFNLINHILFSWSDDLVMSGRLISFVAYTSVLFCAFHWFSQLITKRWLAFIALLPVALQFVVWGFATQARGYECQLACGWFSFISIIKYTQSNSTNALRANTFFNILGIAFIPTYLYILITEMLFVCCIMAHNRAIWRNYFKYQLIACAVIFLLYLPGFCFSGVAAFTSNGYVSPTPEDLSKFISSFIHYSRDGVNFCFSTQWGDYSYMLFLLPMLLFFSKQGERKSIALFYAILWITFILFTFQTMHPPPYRVFIIHYSFTMACVVYTLYVAINVITRHIKKTLLLFLCRLLWIIPVLLFCRFLFITNLQNVTSGLYGNDNNAIYNDYKTNLSVIPAGSNIFLSTSNIYYRYLCRKMFLKVSKYPNSNDDFYIKSITDSFPSNMADKYTFVKKLPDDCALFKRKPP